MTKDTCDNFTKILHSELIPAMGCTEPIAVALAAAKCREVLGCLPEKIVARCSGNIIKNVKSVIVPNTGHRRGIATAAAIGALAGDAQAGLEVIAHVDEAA
ncbi:MAG: serine dehydratase subunit alpha family protein, partial [Lachnospiraceae bacterium]|nr:serine dehydratase subunit alpha family protein [Lachnospiraceae bacterium]